MSSESVTPEELENRLVDFAVRIGNVADALPDTQLGRHISGQMVRSGTTAAPNYAEGCAEESRRDFAHKLSIGLKELRETKTWLRIIQKLICCLRSDFVRLPMTPINSVQSCLASSTRPKKKNGNAGRSAGAERHSRPPRDATVACPLRGSRRIR
jgi:four helix bundle protein